MKVAVFGLGYVGSITAACLAAAGHEVVGIDPDESKVRAVLAGTAPVAEPGLEEVIAEGRRSGLLTASTDPGPAADCEISLLCVSTPSQRNGGVDLTYLDRAASELGEVLARSAGFHTVVVRSTVPPGTLDGRVAPRIADASGRHRGIGFAAASCPEFLREATGMHDFYDPPFLVLGTEDPHAAELVQQLFAFLGRDLTVTGTRTAEMLKYSCNAFHALKVVFANEMGVIARESGADAREVMRLFCTDDRLNLSPRYLSPGFAFGGSCLPKDLRGLVHQARSLDLDVPLLATVAVSNEQHVRRAVDAVIETGRRRVCLLGLSFKPGTDDLRESPQVELAERLLGKGLEVTIYDAAVNPDRLVGRNQAFVAERLPHLNRLLHSDPALALGGAGCAVVATSEPEVVQALLTVRPPRVLDLQGGLGCAVESMPGYEGIAW